MDDASDRMVACKVRSMVPGGCQLSVENQVLIPPDGDVPGRTSEKPRKNYRFGSGVDGVLILTFRCRIHTRLTGRRDRPGDLQDIEIHKS